MVLTKMLAKSQPTISDADDDDRRRMPLLTVNAEDSDLLCAAGEKLVSGS